MASRIFAVLIPILRERSAVRGVARCPPTEAQLTPEVNFHIVSVCFMASLRGTTVEDDCCRKLRRYR